MDEFLPALKAEILWNTILPLCIQVKFSSFWLLLHLCSKPFIFITALWNLGFIFTTKLALNVHRSVWRHFSFFSRPYSVSVQVSVLMGDNAQSWGEPDTICFFLSLRSKLGQMISPHPPPDLWPNVNLENEIQSWKTTRALISSRTAFCAFLIWVLVYACSLIFSDKPESYIVKYSFF